MLKVCTRMPVTTSRSYSANSAGSNTSKNLPNSSLKRNECNGIYAIKNAPIYNINKTSVYKSGNVTFGLNLNRLAKRGGDLQGFEQKYYSPLQVRIGADEGLERILRVERQRYNMTDPNNTVIRTAIGLMGDGTEKNPGLLREIRVGLCDLSDRLDLGPNVKIGMEIRNFKNTRALGLATVFPGPVARIASWQVPIINKSLIKVNPQEQMVLDYSINDGPVKIKRRVPIVQSPEELIAAAKETENRLYMEAITQILGSQTRALSAGNVRRRIVTEPLQEMSMETPKQI